MAMTEKHYTEIAKSVRYAKPSDDASRMLWRTMIISLADIFKKDNANLNRYRFYEACGYEN